MRAFPTGLAMRLGVRVRGRVYRRDLNGEVFDGPYAHDMDADWQAGRLKWGFEFADGRRVTNLDPWRRHSDEPDPAWEPDRPALTGEGGGGWGPLRGPGLLVVAIAEVVGRPARLVSVNPALSNHGLSSHASCGYIYNPLY